MTDIEKVKELVEKRIKEVVVVLRVLRDATQLAYEKGEPAPEVFPLAREIVTGDYSHPDLALMIDPCKIKRETKVCMVIPLAEAVKEIEDGH